MLDEIHESSISRDTDGNNHYILGRIKLYNIVLAGLPWKKAGVGGGAFSIDHDIRVSDVVVSKPEECYGRSHSIGRRENGSRRQIPGHWSSKPGTRHSPKCPYEDESEA